MVHLSFYFRPSLPRAGITVQNNQAQVSRVQVRAIKAAGVICGACVHCVEKFDLVDAIEPLDLGFHLSS